MKNSRFKSKKCTDELLTKYKQKQEIEMFNLGCCNDGKNFTLYFYDELKDEKPLAFLSISFDKENLEIDEFEVIKSQRNNGIGQSIILNIQKDKKINSIKLYAQNNTSKKFWEKCGFIPEDDGFGTELMVWRK